MRRPLSVRGFLRVERLETRDVPATPLTPAQVRHAYGFDQVTFAGGTAGDGTGQTIAIVDAYDDPNIASDLQHFDTQFGIAAPPSFTKVEQTGTVANAGWAGEIALDVEWAHAIAPKAGIVLYEAKSASYTDLLAAVKSAASQPGVSVVSMSWGGSEFSGETSYDSYFTTPSGHTGVTFVASAGDTGAPTSWPSASTRVLSVGGTSLTLNSDGSYNSETGWSSGGGGVSQYETKPTYQGYVSTPSTTKRTDPDVAYNADPNTGVYVYDSYNGGWFQVGGTSAGAPQWAALVAVADQGRALAGAAPLDGASQTLYAVYKMAQTAPADYHDITTGNNGYAAKVGYDAVTGNGSPLAAKVVAGLVGWSGTGSAGALTLGSKTAAPTGGPALVSHEAAAAVDAPAASEAGSVYAGSLGGVTSGAPAAAESAQAPVEPTVAELVSTAASAASLTSDGAGGVSADPNWYHPADVLAGPAGDEGLVLLGTEA